MATDRELIEQVRRGEREVYGQLFRKYYGQIYAICLAMLKNPQDAEDLAQDVFILAYLRLDQLRELGKFLPWLKKITRNLSRNSVRRTSPRMIPLELTKAKMVSEAPDEQVLRQELLDSVMEAVAALPAGDREVVRARIEGLDHAEISEHFGISVQASMNRLFRARKRLADHLKGLCGVFGLVRLEKIISGGIVAMKIGVKAKLAIIGISVLLASGGVLIWYYHQPEQGQSKPIASNIAQETPSKASSSPLPEQKAPEVQEFPEHPVASSETEEISEEDAKKFVAFLNSLEKKPETEATADKSDEDEAAKAWREGLERVRQERSYEARTQIPLLVEEWKDINAKRHELAAIKQRTKALDEEAVHLVYELRRVEDQLFTLAIKYHSVFREEGAVYYPDGWIGRYLKQVGLVWSRGPSSQEDIQAALEYRQSQ